MLIQNEKNIEILLLIIHSLLNNIILEFGMILNLKNFTEESFIFNFLFFIKNKIKLYYENGRYKLFSIIVIITIIGIVCEKKIKKKEH